MITREGLADYVDQRLGRALHRAVVRLTADPGARWLLLVLGPAESLLAESMSEVAREFLGIGPTGARSAARRRRKTDAP